MPRPSKDITQRRTASGVAMSQEEWDKVKTIAAQRNLTLSAAARHLILAGLSQSQAPSFLDSIEAADMEFIKTISATMNQDLSSTLRSMVLIGMGQMGKVLSLTPAAKQ